MAKSLYTAAGWGSLDEITRFLANGVDVDQRFGVGMTALMNAAYAGHTEAVRLLLEAGASVNLANPHGVTALAAAARHANGEVVELLLARGADLELENEQGETPLLVAATYGLASMVRQLLAAGANPHHRSRLGWTSLMCATFNQREGYFPRDSMLALIEAGVAVNACADAHTSAYALAFASRTRESSSCLCGTAPRLAPPFDLPLASDCC